MCIFYCGHLISFQEVGDEFYINIASSYKMEKQPIFELFKKLEKYEIHVCEHAFQRHTGSWQVEERVKG